MAGRKSSGRSEDAQSPDGDGYWRPDPERLRDALKLAGGRSRAALAAAAGMPASTVDALAAGRRTGRTIQPELHRLAQAMGSPISHWCDWTTKRR